MEPSSSTAAELESSGEPCVSHSVCSPYLSVASIAHLICEITVYECPVCHDIFPYPSSLKQHFRTHTGEKPYQCKFCYKRFSVKGSLNTHRCIHTNEGTYMCDKCNKAFVKNGQLRRHMRIHTGERPYECTICSKTFTQSGHLGVHIKMHTKPYGCAVCTRSFTDLNKLTVHIARKHTGEKPYTCDMCGICFDYNYALKRHRETHYCYRCNICNKIFTSKKFKVHIKSHKSDSKCETIQQVRIQPRPRSSSINKYEIDDKRESVLSPATLLDAPCNIPYSYNVCAASPPPAQPQYDTHEQKSGISQDLLDAVEKEYSKMTPTPRTTVIKMTPTSRTTVINFTGRSDDKEMTNGPIGLFGATPLPLIPATNPPV